MKDMKIAEWDVLGNIINLPIVAETDIINEGDDIQTVINKSDKQIEIWNKTYGRGHEIGCRQKI